MKYCNRQSWNVQCGLCLQWDIQYKVTSVYAHSSHRAAQSHSHINPPTTAMSKSPDTNPFCLFEGVNSVVIDQKQNPLEGCCKSCCGACCIDFENVYNVVLPSVGVAFQAREESSNCHRMCCNPNHELTLHLQGMNGKNASGTDVLQIHKPFKCCCPAVFGCCQKEITITKMVPEKQIIGFVKQPVARACLSPS